MRNLADAISSIYDSAVSESFWDNALDKSVELVGARSSSLVVIENHLSQQIQVGRLGGVLRQLDQELIRFYSQNLIEYEREGWDYVLALPSQTLVSDKMVWKQSDREIVQRKDFAFLLEHAGVLRRIAARLNNNKVWSDNIAFQFDKSINVVPSANLALIRLLLPHIAKTIELGRSFNLLRTQYRAVLTMLDYVEIGLCIAIEDGTVIISNSEAEKLFDREDGLILSEQRKLRTPLDSQIELAIRGAIAEISATAAGEPLKSEYTFKVSCRSGPYSYLLEISPVSDSSAELESGLRGAIITIIDTKNKGVIQTERLAKAYELTDAESAIAQYLVDGWINSDIAEARNVSLETIKTQVSSVMRKTGTRRRAEFVRLAVKASPPIKMPNSNKVLTEKGSR